MAGFTYTILTGTKATEGSIKWWGNHSLIPSDQVLTEAQAWIYSRLRVREMRATETVTISASASTFTLPTRYLEPVKLLPNGWSDPIEYIHENLLQRYRDADGALETGDPTEWTVLDEVGTLDSQIGTTALTCKMTYYQKPAALASSTNETNWLTDRYPTLLRHVCTYLAYEHRKRRDASEQLILALKDIDDANVEDDMGRRGQTRIR